MFVLCAGGGGLAVYLAFSEGTPRDYKVQEGCVSAQFPGEPKRIAKGNNRIHYELEFWRSGYIIMLEPMDQHLQGRQGITDEEVKFVMQFVQNQFNVKPGQQILRNNQVTYQGFHGVEVEVKDVDNLRFVFRLFITSRYLIAIGYGSKGELDQAKAERFLDSVKILDPKPGMFK